MEFEGEQMPKREEHELLVVYAHRYGERFVAGVFEDDLEALLLGQLEEKSWAG